MTRPRRQLSPHFLYIQADCLVSPAEDQIRDPTRFQNILGTRPTNLIIHVERCGNLIDRRDTTQQGTKNHGILESLASPGALPRRGGVGGM